MKPDVISNPSCFTQNSQFIEYLLRKLNDNDQITKDYLKFVGGTIEVRRTWKSDYGPRKNFVDHSIPELMIWVKSSVS